MSKIEINNGYKMLGPKPKEVLEMVSEKFPDRFGRLDDYWFAANATDAQKAVDHFIDQNLKEISTNLELFTWENLDITDQLKENFS